jgi:hypothetical protein
MIHIDSIVYENKDWFFHEVVGRAFPESHIRVPMMLKQF